MKSLGIRILNLIFVLIAIVVFSGCQGKEQSLATVGTTNAPSTVTPKGQIQGVVRETCTLNAIQGAKVSISYNGVVQTVTTDANGQYIFTDVPATTSASTAGGVIPAAGANTYQVTISLVDKNKELIAASATATKYPDYIYATQSVVFTDLNDGENVAQVATGGQATTESGSGADTPVDRLSQSQVIAVGKLDGTIKGTIIDEGKNAVEGATVTLTYVAGSQSIPSSLSATTDSTGAFSFTNMPTGGGNTFNVNVEKSGYKRDSATWAGIAPLCNTVVNNLGNLQLVKLAPAADAVKPWIISADYANNSDIPVATTSLKFVFNESLSTAFADINGVSLVSTGLKFKTGQVSTTVSLTTTTLSNDTVVVTPTAISGGYKYTIDLTSIKDKAGNAYNGTRTDAALDGYTAAGIYSFSVNAGATKLTAIADFSQVDQNPAKDEESRDIQYGNTNLPKGNAAGTAATAQSDYNGTLIDLKWSAVTDAKSYNVYASWCDGPYQLVYKGARSGCPLCTFTTTTVGNIDANDVLVLGAAGNLMIEDVRDNTGTGDSKVDAASTGTMDDLAGRLKFVVVSVNADGVESDVSNVVAVKDNVKPIVVSMVVTTAQAGVNTNGTNDGSGTITITYSEPMNYKLVNTASNYTWTNGNTTAGDSTTATSTESPTITVSKVADGVDLNGDGDMVDAGENTTWENATITLKLSNILNMDSGDTLTSVSTDLDGNVTYAPDVSTARQAGKDSLTDTVLPRIVSITTTGYTATAGTTNTDLSGAGITNNTCDTVAGTPDAGTLFDSVTVTFSEEMTSTAAAYGASTTYKTGGITVGGVAATCHAASTTASTVTYYYLTDIAQYAGLADGGTSAAIAPAAITDKAGSALNTSYDTFTLKRSGTTLSGVAEN